MFGVRKLKYPLTATIKIKQKKIAKCHLCLFRYSFIYFLMVNKKLSGRESELKIVQNTQVFPARDSTIYEDRTYSLGGISPLRHSRGF